MVLEARVVRTVVTGDTVYEVEPIDVVSESSVA